jgi:hypothetical protein
MAIDVASETWAEIKKACNQGIEAARTLLESAYCSQDDGMRLRGEINAYRNVLGLPEPLKVQPSGDYTKRTDRSGI